ncbi:hypothetical protein JGU71_28875 [Antrihabitans sp. YC3-6]|uniref:Insoluble domain protein n=2 Tax=Antrihabitans stalagmiti TaxID=2799499 RepID=A0A934NWL4_9NOCA|nr:hypothetical protein [Antrihabitans stalagmiti]
MRSLARRAAVAVSLPLALAVGAAGAGVADPGQPGLAQEQDGDSGQPGLTVTPEPPAPPVVEPEADEPVVERSYLLPNYPQLPARPEPEPEVYTDPTPPVQLQELHAPEPVAPVAPVAPRNDKIQAGSLTFDRGIVPEEWTTRFNIESATAEAALQTFYNSIGVPEDRSQRIAGTQIAGGLTGAVAAALAAGIPAAIVGAAVGAAIGAVAGGLVGTTFLGVGAVPASLAGAGIGAIVGAAALGIPVGVVAGVIGGFLGASVASAYAAGSNVGPAEPNSAPDVNTPQAPSPMPAPVVELPQPLVDSAETFIATNAPAVVETVNSVVTQVESAPGGAALITSAEEAFAAIPPLPALPPPPAQLAPLVAQVGDVIAIAHDAVMQR